MAASTGLTPSQALVLRQVAEHASITPSAVAQTLKFSQATITNITDRLVSANLVTRTRSQSDKRQVMLQVTELGREKLRASPFPLQMRFSQAFAGLETWEQAMMLASLERLNTLLSPSPSGSP